MRRLGAAADDDPPLSTPLMVLGIVIIAIVSVLAAIFEVLLVPTYVGSVIAPISIVVMIVGNLGLPRLMRGIRAGLTVVIPAALWGVTVIVLGFTARPEGDVLLPGGGTDSYVAYALVFGGLVVALVGVMLNLPPVNSSRR